MNDDEINQMAARLESGVPAKDAVVKFMQHGGGPDESHMLANRAGYLRLAALFLRAAITPYEEEGSSIVDVDSSDAVNEDSDVFFAWLERREDIVTRLGEKKEFRPSLADKIFPIGCIMFGLLLFTLVVIGAGTAFTWLLSPR